jgi:pimeloyl-ACP methyl ester carboxylesterase
MNLTLQTGSTYVDASTHTARGTNGVDYAYRDLGESAVPLVLLQHFRGNLDNWDPPLVDALAAKRRVVAFDNVGVGGSSGKTPGTVAEMARDAITFLDAIGLDQVDLLGFSLGSFVAQEIALIRPDVVRRLVLASSAPEGASGMHGWAPDVIAAVGQPQRDPDGYLRVFFTASEPSRQAGKETLQRISTTRSDARDPLSTWATRQAQYDAVCTWGIPDHARLERLGAIDMPVFVANGDSDPMILPHFSHLLAGLIPQAQVKIYPDAAHGFLFQHHAAFATDVAAFLDDEDAIGT